MVLVLRNYVSRDAEATKNVCVDAITRIASNDYSPEQIAAWVAGLPQDLAEWDKQMRSRGSFVAITYGQVVSFTAKNLFESHGFTTVRRRWVSRNGVDLMNFRLEKSLRQE